MSNPNPNEPVPESNPNPNEPVPESIPFPNEPVPGWNQNVPPEQQFRRRLMLHEKTFTSEVIDMTNANVKSVVNLLTRDDINHLHINMQFPLKTRQIKKKGGGRNSCRTDVC